MSGNTVKVLYSREEILGRQVMVFECGPAPMDTYGNIDFDGLAHRTFSVENNNKDVYYEASDMSVQFLKAPFYVGKNPPTNDELAFQLQRWHYRRKAALTVATAIFALAAFLYFLW